MVKIKKRYIYGKKIFTMAENPIKFTIKQKVDGGWNVLYPKTEIAQVEGLEAALNEKEDKSNKVDSISSTSTSTQYPSANAVYLLTRTYVHEQGTAASTWTITHNLGKYPSVTVVDSANSVVIGDVQYTSLNELVVTFTGGFTGKAYLN